MVDRQFGLVQHKAPRRLIGGGGGTMFRTRPIWIPLLLAKIYQRETPNWNIWYCIYWWLLRSHLSGCFGFCLKNCGFSLAQKWPAIAKLLQHLMFLSKIVHSCYYNHLQAKSREGNVFTDICLATGSTYGFNADGTHPTWMLSCKTYNYLSTSHNSQQIQFSFPCFQK